MKKCLLCKRSSQESLPKAAMYQYCPHCKLAWLKKIPKVEYSNDYYTAKSGIVSTLFSPIQRFFYNLRTRYSGRDNVNTWIDVGAGEGMYVQTVPADKKIGIEISNAAREFMSLRGISALTEKEFLMRKTLNADVVSYWHVLEHVDDPIAYLKAGRKHLRPGGIIVCGVPNIDSIEFTFFGDKWFHLVPQYHFWHFTPKSFTALLTRAGFRVERIDYFSVEHHLAGWFQSALNAATRDQNFLHKLVKRGEGPSTISPLDVITTVFWLTAGAPLIVLCWLLASLFHKSGTMVVTATPV